MIVDLTEIEGTLRPFTFSIAADEVDLENPNLTIKGPINVTGQVAKHAAQIQLSGSIDAPVEIACTRCLEPVPNDLKIDFAVNFVRPEDFAADKEREVMAEDLDTDVLDSDRIDLKEVVREQILLNMPEQVFCDPDCKGLCPKCGTNRNLTDCDCDLDERDPRWDALRNLK